MVSHQAAATVTFQCRGCGSSEVTRVVDLGLQPSADYFPAVDTSGEDPVWPLELWLCPLCKLVQLGPVEQIPPEQALVIESDTSRRQSEMSVKLLLGEHPELVGARVYEFGSPHHSGSWFSHLTAYGCRAAESDELADLVVDIQGMTHDSDTGPALRRRVDRLAPDGLLVMEFHHLLPLLLGNQFDVIRHSHWSYLSLTALNSIAIKNGLTIIAARRVDLYGGSLQVILQRRAGVSEPSSEVAALFEEERQAGVSDHVALRRLGDSAMNTASSLHALLLDYRALGRTVVGYGAPSRAPVLLGLSDIGPDLLAFTVDRSPGKHGKRIPGCGVPIRPVDQIHAARPDVVLILTWDIADEVIGQLEANGGWGATYVVPLPQPHVVTETPT